MQAFKKPEPIARRSITLPVPTPESTTTRRSSVAPNPEPQIETLYKHPSVRIVFFTAASVPQSRHHSNNHPGLGEEVGTLSWTSPLERLMAVGPLTVYRAQGSVAFLSCGNVMHPILPKSQCWCVDDSSSKFVLQIRRPQYWRIEVPIHGPENQGTSEKLKDVLSQILLFEKTPCPFKRSFTVELPEAPVTPVKRRPWKPLHTLKSQMDRPESSGAQGEIESIEEYSSFKSDDTIDHQGKGSDSDATDDTNTTPRSIYYGSVLPTSDEQDIVNASQVGWTGRSVTAPPQLTIITSPPSNSDRAVSPVSRSKSIESVSSDYSSSVDSFHTVQSWHSPIAPPSPPESNPASPITYPYPHENISLPKRPTHAREISEITITPESPRVWEISRRSSTESERKASELYSNSLPKVLIEANHLEEDFDEEYIDIAPAPAQRQVRNRLITGRNARNRESSPLPPAANIFSPSRRSLRSLQTAGHFPMAIIQKTYEILLSPPSHLLHLMLNIAAKIAAGEWRGMVFGFGEGGEKIVGEWNYEQGELMEDSWDEDDYGNSLGGKKPSNSNSARDRVGKSWEVD